MKHVTCALIKKKGLFGERVIELYVLNDEGAGYLLMVQSEKNIKVGEVLLLLRAVD